MDILKNYKKLQNGSDIRGVALDGVEGENRNLTPAVACNIAKGFAKWLHGKKAGTSPCKDNFEKPSELKVSIGMDPRITGPDLKAGLICGLKTCFDADCETNSSVDCNADSIAPSVSMTVLDCGLASTPAMFMSTVFPESDCDGAIMITASHLPYNRNGFKFFDKDGGLNKSDITEILETAAEFAASSGCCGDDASGSTSDACCCGDDPTGSRAAGCCGEAATESNDAGCCGDFATGSIDTCCCGEAATGSSDTCCCGDATQAPRGDSSYDSTGADCCADTTPASFNAGCCTDQAEKFDLMTLYCEHLKNIIKERLQGAETINSDPQKMNCENHHKKNMNCSDNLKDTPCIDPDKPLSGIKIVVDAGNGAGGFYATRILEPLGADITGSQFLEPDGNFPNHQPNPENKEAMTAICKAVKENKADLGLIFDTDVDRSAAVDSKGNEISRNGIVALAAALVAEKHPGTTVVTDSITSDQLTVFLEDSLGLKHLRFKRGYKNVINKAIELNNEGIESALAIETSGHAAIKDNYFLDDGAYLATLIVIKAASLFKHGKKIDSVIEELEQPAEANEIRIPIAGEDFAETADTVLDSVTAYFKQNPFFDFAFEDEDDEVDASGNDSAFSNDVTDCGSDSAFSDGGTAGGNDSASDDVFATGISLAVEIVSPNYEGVRLSFKIRNTEEQNIFGWCLLRKSLHDPIIPMNVEANVPGGAKLISLLVYNLLTQFPELDLSVFA